MQNLIQSAIDAALQKDWKKAVEINESILEIENKDVDAMNRLGFALFMLDKLKQAKKIYNDILTIDRFNKIAQKQLDKITSYQKCSKSGKKIESDQSSLSPNSFLEEPGKTKSVILTNTAPASVLSKLNVGDEVLICPKKFSIEIRNLGKTYLGALPDDITFRLIRFLKAGNCYHTCVKNVQKNSISIFIREVKRAKRFQNQPSFLPITYKTSSKKTRTRKKTTKKTKK